MNASTNPLCRICGEVAVYYKAGDWFCPAHLPKDVPPFPEPAINAEWTQATDPIAMLRRVQALEKIIAEMLRRVQALEKIIAEWSSGV